MNQTVKTTIRWQDEDGNVLGAIREREINLPKWGKRDPMRKEIITFLTDLKESASRTTERPESFADYAFKAFRTGKVIQVKSKTNGSFINLKGSELSRFMESNGL
jgi:hypothetical protein